MYNTQTKDNKKWCDLATLPNGYNSDNIHYYMVDNKSQTLVMDTVKYRNNNNNNNNRCTYNAHIVK